MRRKRAARKPEILGAEEESGASVQVTELGNQTSAERSIGTPAADDPTTGGAPDLLPVVQTPQTPRQWVSSQPVVVGRPGPVFEPEAVGGEHRAVPYRPDTLVDGWASESFTIRASSVRGYLHRYNGAPRQDDLAIVLRARERQLLVAVADGVSSAKQSHIGSTTAVRYAVQWLGTNVGEPPADTDWRALVENTAWALVEQATNLFAVDMSAELAEPLIATTLVCAVIEAEEEGDLTAHVISVGDSGAWTLAGGEFTKIEGGKDATESGLTSSAVSGLPRIPIELAAVKVTVSPGQVLLLGTDGFGDPLGDGSGDVGSLFAELLGDRVPSMTEFAHALDFSRETFDDDRTLVAIWPRAESAGGML